MALMAHTCDRVLVRWTDSCVLHGQVDTDDLPSPSEVQTVGWLSYECDDYIVISRDHSPSPGSYSWRSSVAIPRAHILEMLVLVESPLPPPTTTTEV